MLKRVSVLFDNNIRKQLQAKGYESPGVVEALEFLNQVLRVPYAPPAVKPIPERASGMWKLMHVGWYEHDQLRRALLGCDRLVVLLTPWVSASIRITLQFHRRSEKRWFYEVEAYYREGSGELLGVNYAEQTTKLQTTHT